MLERPQPPFTMSGARNAISHGFHHIEMQVEAIEGAVHENPGLAFDLAKNLVESTCRTILTDRGVSWNERDDLARLFREVRDTLPVLPPQESEETEVRQSIMQTLGGLNSTIQGLSELRNRLSFASHGSDRARPTMESAHAILAAQAADAIVGFLYQMHVQDRTPSPENTTATERNPDFDRYVDDQYEVVSILGMDFLASEVLYQMDPESYRDLLADFLNQVWPTEEEV